jgi:hypothetical protein
LHEISLVIKRRHLAIENFKFELSRAIGFNVPGTVVGGYIKDVCKGGALAYKNVHVDSLQAEDTTAGMQVLRCIASNVLLPCPYQPKCDAPASSHMP